MSNSIEFETPENIVVQYKIAGLGTRFTAWLIDSMLAGVLIFIVIFALVFAGLFTGELTDLAGDFLRDSLGDPTGEAAQDEAWIFFVFFSVIMLVSGFGAFVYFFLSELLMRGQTLGKRWLRIRVVKANGFSLDAGSILVRNVFRVIDSVVIMWVVPVLSKKTQRLGDMVSGTLVVREDDAHLSPVREKLLEEEAHQAMFRFSAQQLKKFSDKDFVIMEKFLERYEELDAEKRGALQYKLCKNVCDRLDLEEPKGYQEMPFLRDLLAAEYRRRHKMLG